MYITRGTNGFTITTAFSSSAPFHFATQGNLRDATQKLCEDIPIETFTLNSTIYAQYIRFYITSNFGLSGGLQYFAFSGQKAQEQGMDQLGMAILSITAENLLLH